MKTPKQEVLLLLSKMPEEFTIEEFLFYIYVLQKMREGIPKTKSDENPAYEEAEEKIKNWLNE